MSRAALGPGLLIGAGLAGTLDEVVFHQLLRWHHFYDGSQRAGLISDGLFHAASTLALAAGLVLLWRRRAVGGRHLAAGVLIGLGAFNLYDGTVQHKLLELHQIRPAAGDQLPYDLAWNAAALAALALGVVLRRRAVGSATTTRGAGGRAG